MKKNRRGSCLSKLKVMILILKSFWPIPRRKILRSPSPRELRGCTTHGLGEDPLLVIDEDLFWNAIGLANSGTRLVLMHICATHKPDLIFLTKCYTSFHHFPACFFFFWIFASPPQLSVIGEVLFQTFCCLCTSSLAFSTNTIATFDQHVSLVVSINNQVTHIAIVYGSISYILKRRLGENLVMDH